MLHTANTTKIISWLVLAWIQFSKASALVCLGCDSIYQPRHCHTVANCKADEVCGAETVHGEDGYLNYKLGCVKHNTCPSGNLWSNGSFCRQCCDSDICNAQVCGEPGYPAQRGPICYDCTYHTSAKPCRTIGFCSMTEECSVERQDEFGDVILMSTCKQRNFCPSSAVSIVGKRSTLQERSGNHILCESCCKTDLCNLNCSNSDWGQWSSWGICSVTCAGGNQSRHRNCSLTNGNSCSGNPSETRMCNTNLCAVDGTFSLWSAWSVCTQSCGKGTTTRHRNCTYDAIAPHGNTCFGNSTETQVCNQNLCPVDGMWSSWTNWAICSTTCGAGTQSRMRQCEFPIGAPRGQNCTGPADEQRNCSNSACPVDGMWGSWAIWATCSKTCGTGVTVRARRCEFPITAPHGKDCSGSTTELRNCSDSTCPVDGHWSSWTDWTICSTTCGAGTQFKTRRCEFPIGAPRGQNCTGSADEQRNCSNSACPVDGMWGSWAIWATCSKTCGTGVTVRARRCEFPITAPHGKDCSGSTTELRNCSDSTCPVDGHWSSWTDWTICSTTCGAGTQFRTRRCEFPITVPRGQNCSGSTDEQRNCSDSLCPGDGFWTAWNNWSTCSQSCNTGTRSRSRNCTYTDGLPHGSSCFGANNETEICNADLCPVDGAWSQWGNWGSCPVTCGAGSQQRTRTCVYPVLAAPHGTACFGNRLEEKGCNSTPCPVDGVWQQWGSWAACTATCDGGVTIRRRTCYFPPRVSQGDYCTGRGAESHSCNMDPCPGSG